MLTERQKLALVGALALATGIVTTTALTGGEDKATRDATHESIGSAIKDGSAVGPAKDVDTEKYHDTIKEVRAVDPNAIDLLTAPVEPGAEITTSVTLARGKRTTGEVEFIGPDAAGFEMISVTHVDSDSATRVEVKALNKGAKAARMIGFIRLEP